MGDKKNIFSTWPRGVAVPDFSAGTKMIIGVHAAKHRQLTLEQSGQPRAKEKRKEVQKSNRQAPGSAFYWLDGSKDSRKPNIEDKLAREPESKSVPEQRMEASDQEELPTVERKPASPPALMSRSDVMKQKNPVLNGAIYLRPLVRPSDEVLIELILKDPKYKQTMTFHFRDAVDLWIRMVLDGYLRATGADHDRTGEFFAMASSYDRLSYELHQETLDMTDKHNLSWAECDRGSWKDLRDVEVVRRLEEYPYHNRLFRLLRECGYEPRHWSSAVLVRHKWFWKDSEDEPLTPEEYGSPLGPLEFIIKAFLRKGNVRLRDAPHIDDETLVSDLLDLSECFAPSREKDAWWL
ncbi:hypothetical protein BJ508DRAFT_305452 [Ascobolus immersus RN42]|uniref:Uncharacterized protein n=1 Tax=Ascobolus immersus RN42 TaxID=1160509 RepID=A0A3N4IAS8_ASCIM|nr:hypothetical protein BJ508DRAFT_305452 [Ascobolus immersus RN42]